MRKGTISPINGQLKHLTLEDGRRLPYLIRTSSRRRSVQLRITVEDGLIVAIPSGGGHPDIAQLLREKIGWILSHLARTEEIRRRAASPEAKRPTTIALCAIGHSWSVIYRETKAGTVDVQTDHHRDAVLLSGPTEDERACQVALCRWLSESAREVLGPWLVTLAREKGFVFTNLTIRRQQTRWGSCSSEGAISLNCKLLFLPKELVRYVLIHELCHTVEHNHSRRFWNLVRQHEPEADVLRRRMHRAWQTVPPWAHHT
jgi:predicted metal-dependent hydrolase